MGQVLVSIPTLGDRQIWALPATDLHTDWKLPYVGDIVWIYFQGGDGGHPVWAWGWILPTKTPTEVASYPNNADPGPRVLRWKNMKIVMNDDSLSIQNEDATTSIDLRAAGTPSIEITSPSDVRINSGGRIIMNGESVETNSGGNASLISPNDVVIGAGSNIDMSAVGELAVRVTNKLAMQSSNEVSIKAGLTPVDARGIEAGVNKTEISHPLLNVLNAQINKIGGEGATEPLVLGTMLNTFLTAVLQMIQTHTHVVSTPAGPGTAAPSVELLTGVPPKVAEVTAQNLVSTTNFTKK
jgi:hypothetical protein